MRAGAERALPLAMLLALASIAGCEGYAETVGCAQGTVLNEDDECVPPPIPDGGVAVETCAELCELLASGTMEQATCVQGMLGSFGPPPDECMGDLTDPATCNACVMAAGAMDAQCATAGALCQ
ncbi:MAG TPA: hypothetical protein RMH99_10015 [Sandaracinaceae bacterium LLY-WYZ-13_1]|nr:hypothetical protein [Sandaracinaceae bacterium LLY-WYZ-13_1]